MENHSHRGHTVVIHLFFILNELFSQIIQIRLLMAPVAEIQRRSSKDADSVLRGPPGGHWGQTYCRVWTDGSSVCKLGRGDDKGLDGRNKSPRPTRVIAGPFLGVWPPWLLLGPRTCTREHHVSAEWMSTIFKVDCRILWAAFNFTTVISNRTEGRKRGERETERQRDRDRETENTCVDAVESCFFLI